jgi:hypothetical protein
MTRMKMSTTKASTAFADYTTTANPFSGSYSGVAQFVSDPLNGAVSITASGWRPPIVRVKNNSGEATKELAYLMRVFTNDGSTVRGTLYSRNWTNGNDFGATYESRAPAQDNMTAVSAQDGDRIVIEVGFRNNGSGAGSNSIEIGDSAASDLGTTSGETNQYNPWSEIVALTLSFQTGGTDHTQTVSNSITASQALAKSVNKALSLAIQTFGPAPSTKWGETYSMVWGTSKWGEGSLGLQTDVAKVISNSQTVDLSLSTVTAFNVSFSYQITSAFEGTQETLQDAAGYYYLFTGGVTDGDERATATYSEQSGALTSWTSGTVASTSWS